MPAQAVPPADILVLPERLAAMHDEFATEHANAIRYAMRVELPYSDVELYESVVDEVGEVGQEHDYWKLCCETLGRTFDINQAEATRFHDRYDSLRGIRVSSMALAAVRRFEVPDASEEYVDQITHAPFETRVNNRQLKFLYPHWDMDDGPLDVNYFRMYFPPSVDPPLRASDTDRRRYFFTSMRAFLKGVHKLTHSKVPLIHSFADAADGHFLTAERSFERELFLLSAGYMKKAGALLEDRLTFIRNMAEFRVANIAFECLGVRLKALSPAGHEAYIAGIPLIAEELRDSVGDADVPEVTDRLVREIAVIERQPTIPDLSAGDSFGMGIA